MLIGVLVPGLAWDFLRPAQSLAAASGSTLATPPAAPDQGPFTPEALRGRLQVTSLPDTRLVGLAAVGGEHERLAVLVNAWVDAYQDLRRERVEREVGALRQAPQAPAISATPTAVLPAALPRVAAATDVDLSFPVPD